MKNIQEYEGAVVIADNVTEQAGRLKEVSQYVKEIQSGIYHIARNIAFIESENIGPGNIEEIGAVREEKGLLMTKKA